MKASSQVPPNSTNWRNSYAEAMNNSINTRNSVAEAAMVIVLVIRYVSIRRPIQCYLGWPRHSENREFGYKIFPDRENTGN